MDFDEIRFLIENDLYSAAYILHGMRMEIFTA